MLIIEIPVTDKDDALSYIPTATVVESKAFDGAQIVALIVALSTAILPSLAKMITAYYNAKKEIRIKYNGLEIQGLNKDNALEILEKFMEEENKNKDVEKPDKADKGARKKKK